MEYIQMKKKNDSPKSVVPIVQRLSIYTARDGTYTLKRPSKHAECFESNALSVEDLYSTVIEQMNDAIEIEAVLTDYIETVGLKKLVALKRILEKESSFCRSGTCNRSYGFLCSLHSFSKRIKPPDEKITAAFASEMLKMKIWKHPAYSDIERQLSLIKLRMTDSKEMEAPEQNFLIEWLKSILYLTAQFPCDFHLQQFQSDAANLLAQLDSKIKIPSLPAPVSYKERFKHSYQNYTDETQELPSKAELNETIDTSKDTFNVDRTDRYNALVGLLNASPGKSVKRYRLYRTMPLSEALGILQIYNDKENWHLFSQKMSQNSAKDLRSHDKYTFHIGKHLGNREEAAGYMARSMQEGGEPKVLVEFVLKKQAAPLLFSKGLMALFHDSDKAGYSKASQNEGMAPGKFGLKYEQDGKGYSIGIQGEEDSPSDPMRFLQLMTEQIHIIGYKYDNTPPLSHIRSHQANIITVNGVNYNTASNPVSPGQCLWAILRKLPFWKEIEAAIAGTPFEQQSFVDDDQLPALVEQINQNLPAERQICILLDVFDYSGSFSIQTQTIGTGTRLLRIGLVFDPIAESGVQLGHYIQPESPG